MTQDNKTLVLVFLIWVTLCECGFIKPILNWYNLHLRKCIAAWLVITLEGSRPLTLCLSPTPTYFIFCWFLFSENIIIKHNQTLFCSHTWFRHLLLDSRRYQKCFLDLVEEKVDDDLRMNICSSAICFMPENWRITGTGERLLMIVDGVWAIGPSHPRVQSECLPTFHVCHPPSTSSTQNI